jgi:hypothetical protein
MLDIFLDEIDNQDFVECASAYGLYDDTYALTQLPFLSQGCFRGDYQACYKANAIDQCNREYVLRWPINDHWDGQDESEACDWEYFTVNDR